MPLTLEFKQSNYLPGSNGVCLSLSSSWAKSMLLAPKNWWSAPTSSPQDRISRFYLDKKEVLGNQAVYEKRGERQTENLAALQLAALVAKRSNLQGMTSESGMISVAIKPAITDLGVSIKNHASKAIESHGIKVTNRQECAWSAITPAIPEAHPVIFTFDTGPRSGHAIGIYRTKGITSNDFYVFDPNFGEFVCSGAGQFEKFMTVLQSVNGYNKPANASIYTVGI